MATQNQKKNGTDVIRFTGPRPAGAQFTGGPRRVDPHTARVLARHERQIAMLRFLRDAVVAGPALLLKWYRRNALYRELSALPDCMLADIGLERGRIADVVYGRRPWDDKRTPGAAANDSPEPAKPEPRPQTPIAA